MSRRGITPPSLPQLTAFGICAVVLLPVVYLGVGAAEGGVEVWKTLGIDTIAGLIWRTTVLAAATTTASLALSLPLAWLMTCSDLPCKKIWITLTSVPLAIPSYLGAFALIAALGRGGLIFRLLEGANTDLVLPDIYGFWGAFVVLTLFTYPYMLLNLRGALQRVDPSLQDAARMLGYNRWTTFWKVIFPQVTPAIASGGLLVALYTVRDFGAVSMLQYNTFTRAIYIQYQSAFDRSGAAALGLVLVALTVIILAVESRARSSGARYYGDSSHSRRTPDTVSLGIWGWPAAAFCLTVVLFSLIIPVAVIIYWLVRGLAAGEQLTLFLQPFYSSLGIAGAAAVATTIAALPAALWAAWRPCRISEMLQKISYLGFGLPGVVIGLALVFAATRRFPGLYQTLPLLVLGYMIQFLPQAGGAIRTSAAQVNPELPQAARTLGTSNLQILLSVTLPLIRPGAIAGAALVFLTTIKELPITLLLAPAGFETLSTLVWGATQEAFYARAALPAVMLLLASSLSMAVFTYTSSNPDKEGLRQ